MAVSKDPGTHEAALFGVFGLWPKWKTVTFEAAFSREITDSTYDGTGATELLGGDSSEAFSGTRVWTRWTDGVLAAGLDHTNAFLHGSGYSNRIGGGGLYTHRGDVAHPDPVEDGTLTHSVDLSCEWGMQPALELPVYSPRVPGLLLERSPADGRSMFMLGSVASLFFGWGSGGGTDAGTEFTIEATRTGFEPVYFNLEDIALEPFVFSKTSTTLTTYHPSDPDTAGPPPYYPMRGTYSQVLTADLTLTFAP